VGRPKRTLFTALGWLVWKLLAVFGVTFAQDKLREGRSGRGRVRR
jgi:hypothetical protein